MRKRRVPRTPGQARRLRYLALYEIAGWSPRYASRWSRLKYAYRVGRKFDRVLSP